MRSSAGGRWFAAWSLPGTLEPASPTGRLWPLGRQRPVVPISSYPARPGHLGAGRAVLRSKRVCYSAADRCLAHSPPAPPLPPHPHPLSISPLLSSPSTALCPLSLRRSRLLVYSTSLLLSCPTTSRPPHSTQQPCPRNPSRRSALPSPAPLEPFSPMRESSRRWAVCMLVCYAAVLCAMLAYAGPSLHASGVRCGTSNEISR